MILFTPFFGPTYLEIKKNRQKFTFKYFELQFNRNNLGIIEQLISGRTIYVAVIAPILQNKF